MIGIDTNVLVRYIVRDDQKQAELADKVFESLSVRESGFISQVVLCEIWWVLGAAYVATGQSRTSIIGTLLSTRGIIVDGPEQVRAELTATTHGADFADALIAAHGERAGCQSTVTFDKKAARVAGMKLLVDSI